MTCSMVSRTRVGMRIGWMVRGWRQGSWSRARMCFCSVVVQFVRRTVVDAVRVWKESQRVMLQVGSL